LPGGNDAGVGRPSLFNSAGSIGAQNEAQTPDALLPFTVAIALWLGYRAPASPSSARPAEVIAWPWPSIEHGGAGREARLVRNLSLWSAVVSTPTYNLRSPLTGGCAAVRLISILLALFFAGSAAADDWKDYENPDYAFTIHFPLDPTVETATYQAADGRSLPAHIFSVKQDTGTFKVTVVEMPGKQTGSNAAVMKEATKVVAAGGTIKFDIDHRVRAVYGRQLGIAGTNGGYSYVALFYRNNRLYLIEGNAFVAGGRAEVEAMRFQQSLDLT
jgi:hypothetical protein